MSSIEFYYMPESPPCRTVEMVAELVGVRLNKNHINLAKKEQFAENFVKLNPRHKVPFIIDGELKINESRAIARYLVNNFSPNDEYLYPKNPEERAYVDEFLDFELGTLYPAAYKLFSPLLLGPVKQLNPDDEKIYREILQYIDDRLDHNGAKRFLIGNHLTIADASLSAALTFPIACGYDLHEYYQIISYIERIKAAIPRFSEINDVPTENIRKYIQSKQTACCTIDD